MPDTPPTFEQRARAARIRLGCMIAPVALISLALLIARCAPGAEDPQPIGPSVFAFAIVRGTPATAPESKARAACGDRPFCTVIGFRQGKPLPGSMPLTEDQAADIIFQFTRSSGDRAGRSLWNCAAFPDAPKRSCTDSRGD